MAEHYEREEPHCGGRPQPASSNVVSLFRDWSVAPSHTAALVDDNSLHRPVGQARELRSPAKPATDRQSGQTSKRSKTASSIDRPLPPPKSSAVSHARKTSPDHVKRPRNAFILFRSHTVAENLIPKEVEKDHRNISRIVSHMWKSLDDTERSKWTRQALQEKEEHKRLYPDYKYKPSVRTTVVARRNVKKLENGEEECQEIADVILKAQGREGLVLTPAKHRESTRKRARKEATVEPRKVVKTRFASIDGSQEVLNAVLLHSTSDIRVEDLPRPPRTSTVGQGEEPVIQSIPMQRRASSAPPSPYPLTCEAQAAGAVDVLRYAQASGLETSRTVRHKLVPFAPGSRDFEIDNQRRVKPRPAPIFNTWQFGFDDDHAGPQNLALEATATDMSSSSSLRPVSAAKNFFNPWVCDTSSNYMLMSPMRSTIKDLRRTSSLACFQPEHRPSLGGITPHASDHKSSANGADTVNLFEEAARAAAANLEAELDDFSLDPSLPFDEFLQHLDDHPVFTHASNLTRELSRDRRWSPRLSFCGSTLAAAARDWTNRNNGRTADTTVESSEPHWPEVCAPSEPQVDKGQQQEYDAQPPSLDALKDSIERAVTDVLKKVGDQLGDNDQGAALTREILASLSAQLSQEASRSSSDDLSIVAAEGNTGSAFRDDASRSHYDEIGGRSATVDPRRQLPMTVSPRRPSSQYASPLQLALFH